MATSSGRSAAAKKRKLVALDLRFLADALLHHGICNDVGPIHSAAEQCLRGDSAAPNEWAYEVTLLTFSVPALDGGLPAVLGQAKLQLSISARGYPPEIREDSDPFTALAVDLRVVALAPSGYAYETVSAAWHFDRHVGTDEDGRGPAHPLYHVQYGGNAMKSLDLAETLLSDPPRLIYPPLDAILAVDLVLSNFLATEWHRLREDGAYRRLTSNAYREFWAPWFATVSRIWEVNAALNWLSKSRLCPVVPKPQTNHGCV